MKNLSVKYKELVLKYLSGEISSKDRVWVESKIESSSENKDYFIEVKRLYSETEHLPEDYVYNIDKAWNNLYGRINKSAGKRKVTGLIPARQILVWRWAAVLALFIGLTFGSLYISDSKEMIHTFIAQKGQKSNVILADGTTVWLNSGSSIKVSNKFNKKHRTIELQGEAFFDVKKDMDNPFIVSTHLLDIKVLGTKFNVSAYKEDMHIVTTLEEGKVSVYHKKGKCDPVNLNPGEQIVFNKNKSKAELKKVNTNLYTSWKNNALKFSNAPFADVVKKLERWFDVKIILEDDLKYTERYTMTIKTESLREVLELLKITTPFEYKINENKVFIYSLKLK